MAIPNSPDWSSLTDVKPYPETSFTQPSNPTGVHAISLGPTELSDSRNKLNSRYWLVTQSGGQVFIQGSLLQ